MGSYNTSNERPMNIKLNALGAHKESINLFFAMKKNIYISEIIDKDLLSKLLINMSHKKNQLS